MLRLKGMHKFDLLNNEQKNILEKIPHVGQIDGGLFLTEAVKLFELSSKIEAFRPVICEIGTWKGKSSYIFASAMKERNGVLYCVDPFNADGDNASKNDYLRGMKKLDVSLFKNFEITMNMYGLLQYIKVIPMLSENAHLEFPEQRIDLLFVDGNHEYESVKKDYELWSPLLPSGGILVLHDIRADHVDGPKRVMQEYVAHSRYWNNVQIVGEMGIATKI